MASKPVGSNHARLEKAIAIGIVKLLRRRGVEAQKTWASEAFRRGKYQDFVGEPLPDQSCRHAWPPLAKNPCQATLAKES